MLACLLALLRWVFAALGSRRQLVLENLALRHQLLVLQRQRPKPRLHSWDRLLWVALRRLWPDWYRSLMIFQPQTVVRWHRAGFRMFWRWKSRRRGGRPAKDKPLTQLIGQMWQSNLTWGSRRIQAELAKLGIQVSDSTIRKYRPHSCQAALFFPAPENLPAEPRQRTGGD